MRTSLPVRSENTSFLLAGSPLWLQVIVSGKQFFRPIVTKGLSGCSIEKRKVSLLQVVSQNVGLPELHAVNEIEQARSTISRREISILIFYWFGIRQK